VSARAQGLSSVPGHPSRHQDPHFQASQPRRWGCARVAWPSCWPVRLYDVQPK